MKKKRFLHGFDPNYNNIMYYIQQYQKILLKMDGIVRILRNNDV